MGGAGDGGDQQGAWAGAAVAVAHAAAEHVSAAAAHVAAVAAEPGGFQQPGAVLALEEALRAALGKVEGLRARAGAPSAAAGAPAAGGGSSEGALRRS